MLCCQCNCRLRDARLLPAVATAVYLANPWHIVAGLPVRQVRDVVVPEASRDEAAAALKSIGRRVLRVQKAGRRASRPLTAEMRQAVRVALNAGISQADAARLSGFAWFPSQVHMAQFEDGKRIIFAGRGTGGAS